MRLWNPVVFQASFAIIGLHAKATAFYFVYGVIACTMYLISVYFDDKSNKQLQRYCKLIAEKTGNTFMTEHKVPPHMTIAAIEARNVELLCPAFESLNGRTGLGQIQFVSIGLFLPYVMYVTPVLNAYLFDLQKSIYETIRDIPETTVGRFYQPHSWLPHVTLGKMLDKQQMLTACKVMQEQFVPFTADITEIGLATVNPHRDVRRFSLR